VCAGEDDLDIGAQICSWLAANSIRMLGKFAVEQVETQMLSARQSIDFEVKVD
jgi:hypothetical protein